MALLYILLLGTVIFLAIDGHYRAVIARAEMPVLLFVLHIVLVAGIVFLPFGFDHPEGMGDFDDFLSLVVLQFLVFGVETVVCIHQRRIGYVLASLIAIIFGALGALAH